MKAYIITLMNRPDRVASANAIAARLTADGFTPEIFPATRMEGYEFTQIDYSAARHVERPMTAGELACAWSHYRICQKIAESEQPAFVYEDDAFLFRDLSSVKVEGVKHLLSGSAWYPEFQHDKFSVISEVPERHSQFTCGLPYGTQGYYVTVEGAQVLRDFLPPIRWASDVALDRLSKLGVLKTELAISPWAGQNNDITSHIRRP